MFQFEQAQEGYVPYLHRVSWYVLQTEAYGKVLTTGAIGQMAAAFALSSPPPLPGPSPSHPFGPGDDDGDGED